MSFGSKESLLAVAERCMRSAGITGGSLQDSLAGLRAKLAYGVMVGRCDQCNRIVSIAVSMEAAPTWDCLCECGWRGVVTNWGEERFE